MEQIKTIGIIGYGNFGAFVTHLIQRYLPDVRLRVYSRRHPTSDGLFADLPRVAESDVLIFACGIGEYAELLTAVLPHASNNTIFVDVATVKEYTVNLFKQKLSDRPYICTHPMFGPESYKKKNHSVIDFRIVISEHTVTKAQYTAGVAFLSGLGCIVLELSAEEHDRHLAETLFLTHYIGQSIQASGFERTEIDTVSFSFLMDAVESVIHDTKLFEDVYRFNPFCKDAAARFHTAQKKVIESLEKSAVQ